MSKDTNKVTYQTFVDDLESGNILRADLYSFGQVDFTYETQDELTKTVDIPLEASKNSLLIKSLKNNSVKYTSHDEPYPKEASDNSWIQYSGFSIMLIPILLIVVIIIQARTISSLTKRAKASE